MILTFQIQKQDGCWQSISAPLDIEYDQITGLIRYLKMTHKEGIIRVISERQEVIFKESIEI